MIMKDSQFLFPSLNSHLAMQLLLVSLKHKIQKLKICETKRQVVFFFFKQNDHFTSSTFKIVLFLVEEYNIKVWGKIDRNPTISVWVGYSMNSYLLITWGCRNVVSVLNSSSYFHSHRATLMYSKSAYTAERTWKCE